MTPPAGPNLLLLAGIIAGAVALVVVGGVIVYLIRR